MKSNMAGMVKYHYGIALHCIALHCIALHCIALHCIALHCIALHGMVWCGMKLVWYDTSMVYSMVSVNSAAW